MWLRNVFRDYCSHTTNGNSFDFLFFAVDELENKQNQQRKLRGSRYDATLPLTFASLSRATVRGNRATVLCSFQNVCERLAENHLCSGRNKFEFMRINTKMPCDTSNSNPLLQIIIYTRVCLTPKHQSTHMSKLFLLLSKRIWCWDCKLRFRCCCRRKEWKIK